MQKSKDASKTERADLAKQKLHQYYVDLDKQKFEHRYADMAMQELREYYEDKDSSSISKARKVTAKKLTRIVPKILERSQKEAGDASDESAFLFTGLLPPIKKKRAGKGKVVMLIVAEGNDIRAKKEADILKEDGYEVVFVGRKNGLTDIEEDMDGQFKIIRVPTITNAETLRSVIRNNKSCFSFMEKRLAGFLAFIFEITNFSMGAQTTKPPISKRLLKVERLERLAQESRAQAIQSRSIFLFVKFAVVKVLSFFTKNIFSLLLLPFVIVIAIIVLPFNLLDKGVAVLDRRAASSWAGLMQPRGIIGILRSLTNILIAKFAGIFKFFLSTLPRKLIAGIKAVAVWPFVKIRNRVIGYLSPRARLIHILFSYFFFYLETKAEVIKQKPDIVHSHDLYMLQAATKAAKAVNAKVVYDAHELETDRHSGLHPRVKKNIAKQECRYGKQADGVITVSLSILKVMQNNLERDDVIIVYNAPMMNEFAAASDDNIRSELNLAKNMPLAIFVGKLYNIHTHDHRINNIIEALAYIPKMHLVILGAKSTNAVTEITVWAERYFVSDRVHLVEPVPYEDLLGYITTVDLGINPMQNKCLNTDYSMPNKVFEMSLAGIPVAQSNLKDSVRYLNHFNMGIPMDAMDAKDIARAMVDVYSGRKHMKKSSQDLQSMRDEFGWKAQGKKLLSLYERVQRV